MNVKEFFDGMALKWDKICTHDGSKLRRIMELSAVKKGAKILDVGTGTGALIGCLLELAPSKITALDISDKMIEEAKNKYNDDRVEFIVSDIMDYKGEGFDYIFLFSVYPHFFDKDSLFKHLYGLMNAGGKIIIAHSKCKEKINEIHQRNAQIKNDILPSGEITAGIMSRYFKAELVIDNEELYFISGIKEA